MPEYHRREDKMDPEFASLFRVKLGTWKVVLSVFAWLLALSGSVAFNARSVAANTRAIEQKADTATVMSQRKDDRDLLAAKLDMVDRRLQSIESYQERQARAAEDAASIAKAIRAEREGAKGEK